LKDTASCGIMRSPFYKSSSRQFETLRSLGRML
jgi:hypothetical protein